MSSFSVWKVPVQLKVPPSPLQVWWVCDQRRKVLRISDQRFPNRTPPCLQELGASCARERGQGCYCAKREDEPTWSLLHQSHHPLWAAPQVSSVCPLGGKEVKGHKDGEHLLAGQMESELQWNEIYRIKQRISLSLILWVLKCCPLN